MSVALRAAAPPVPSSLLHRVAQALAAAGVRHCQWKGHLKRERWMSGDGDVDLLVGPEALAVVFGVLHEHGFRTFGAPEDHGLPGTWHVCGPAPDTERLLHVHVHTRILVEAARGTVYRLPLEDAMLASSRPGAVFPTPAPELELLAFVLRTTVRWASWRRVPAESHRELAQLERLADPEGVLGALYRYFPAVGPALFQWCRRAIEPGATIRTRWAARRGLTRRLAPLARLPGLTTRIVHAWRAAAWHLRGGNRRESRARLTGGGMVYALVGSDGAGKSTCTRALRAWLSQNIETRAYHLGLPRRSWATLAVSALLRVAAVRPLDWAWHACIARDRYRLALRAWRFALDGGIALVERYPLGPHHALAGPQVRKLAGPAPSRFARWLATLEEGYYARLPVPDRIFVLDVDPDAAVRRKTDEPSAYVRARAELTQQADWAGAGTRVRRVDANRALADVLADLKTLIWQAL